MFTTSILLLNGCVLPATLATRPVHRRGTALPFPPACAGRARRGAERDAGLRLSELSRPERCESAVMITPHSLGPRRMHILLWSWRDFFARCGRPQCDMAAVCSAGKSGAVAGPSSEVCTA